MAIGFASVSYVALGIYIKGLYVNSRSANIFASFDYAYLHDQQHCKAGK